VSGKEGRPPASGGVEGRPPASGGVEERPPASGPAETPGLARRLASLFYELVSAFAIAFAGSWAFFLASGGRGASGWPRHLLQLFLAACIAGYFLWCWRRGGQTLAMRAWRIRLVAPGFARAPWGAALLRLAAGASFALAGLAALALAHEGRSAWLAGASLALAALPFAWALFDPERQFLHDRLAGTRLVLLPRRLR